MSMACFSFSDNRSDPLKYPIGKLPFSKEQTFDQYVAGYYAKKHPELCCPEASGVAFSVSYR